VSLKGFPKNECQFQSFHRSAPFTRGMSLFQSFQSFNRFAPFKSSKAGSVIPSPLNRLTRPRGQL